jgi:protein-disulfide isomerase
MLTRRSTLLGSAALISTAGNLNAQGATGSVPMGDVLAARNAMLPDLVYGPDNAKVTIVEYASTTCGHCARFHNDIWPAFKAKYVDTNRVRYIFRNFVLNPLDAAASMLSYCGPAERRNAFIEFLFKQQERWAFTSTPLDSLLSAARQAGFTQETFNACLQRRELYDALIASKDGAAERFRINSTPTFIINGQVFPGARTLQEFDRIIEPLLAA